MTIKYWITNYLEENTGYAGGYVYVPIVIIVIADSLEDAINKVLAKYGFADTDRQKNEISSNMNELSSLFNDVFNPDMLTYNDIIDNYPSN